MDMCLVCAIGRTQAFIAMWRVASCPRIGVATCKSWRPISGNDPQRLWWAKASSISLASARHAPRLCPPYGCCDWRRRMMDALPEFQLLRPTTLAEVLTARAAHPASRLIGGGTDLIVNIRRGIEAPPGLLDMNGGAGLHGIVADARRLEIGASVTVAEVAGHPAIVAHYPVLAQAAHVIAGPTHRNMGTVGGNLCLDTRCIFYNQSEWWRAANNHCLKTTGDICHVAPKSHGVCFATFSGDLAPALLTLGAEIDLAGPPGRRTLPPPDPFIGHARPRGAT